jgi:hypothetical protein
MQQKELHARETKASVLVLSCLLALSFSIPILAAQATSSTYSFNLVGPNTAFATVGPFAGDTIRLTGSGVFDASAASVTASGSFTHYCASCGGIIRGTWVATGFTSFTAYGGPNPGIQGGLLVITVTLYPNGGSPHPGAMLQISCEVNAPPGSPDEGTTIPNFGFTEPTGGHTLFHLNN